MRETKMSTHLSGGRLNVASVQESMRTELLNLLQLYKGPKVCILLLILGIYYQALVFLMIKPILIRL